MSASILIVGRPLHEHERALAVSVGVDKPELIRLLELETLPEPDNADLRQHAHKVGLLGERMIGLTLGHGVCLRTGHYATALLAHEFRHVYQYEQAGSIGNFLAEYLRQLVTLGYDLAPLELDARHHAAALSW